MTLSLHSLPRPNPRSAEPEILAREIVDRLTYRVGKDPKVAKPHDWLQAVILITRDRAIEYWMNATREHLPRGREAGLLPEPRVPDRPADARRGLEPRADRADARGAEAARRRLRRDRRARGRRRARQRRPRPARRLLHGEHGDGRACRPTATASATATACSARRSSTATRSSCPRPGSSTATPGSSTAARPPTTSASAARVEYHEPNGAAERFVWHPAEQVKATAYDTPIVGWRAARVNTLRLWKADPIDPIRLDAFNAGDHAGSLAESNRADALTRVLYPADTSPAGQELRLRQEYFFSSASLQDILRRHNQQYGRFDNLAREGGDPAQRHPPGGLRRRADAAARSTSTSSSSTRPGSSPSGTIAYTNHTLLPEALETWPVPLFERLLPRHMQIIYEINARLLKSARDEHKMDDAEIRAVSLIDENGERRVRMGNLAFVGAHSINGVSALHSELLKVTVFKDLHRMFPDRINNKTNGITPRRWLMQCNPGLTGAHHRDHRRPLPRRHRRAPRPRALRRGPGLPGRLRPGEAAEQGPAGPAGARPHGHPARPERDVRHPGQAHPRIQAPAAEHHRGGGALRPDPLPPGAELGAAGEDLRRQGGADLPQRQADHQARQRRRPGHQLQSRRCAAC